MSDDKKPTEVSTTEFDIGFDSNPPKVMFISIPLQAYAEDEKNGTALLYGKMFQAQSRAAQLILQLRGRLPKNQLVKPGQKPMDVVN